MRVTPGTHLVHVPPAVTEEPQPGGAAPVRRRGSGLATGRDHAHRGARLGGRRYMVTNTIPVPDGPEAIAVDSAARYRLT